MTPTEALNILVHIAAERISDARAAGHPMSADLLAMNAHEAQRVLSAALEPAATVPVDYAKRSPCN